MSSFEYLDTAPDFHQLRAFLRANEVGFFVANSFPSSIICSVIFIVSAFVVLCFASDKENYRCPSIVCL